MYGANYSTRTGDTNYGGDFFNAGRAAFTLDRPHPHLVSIWDGGGIDTLDFSGEQRPVVVDLDSGAFSSFFGMGLNLSIAFGTTIENAWGGSGDDEISGNDAANTLRGLAGSGRRCFRYFSRDRRWFLVRWLAGGT
jgi:serralysin